MIFGITYLGRDTSPPLLEAKSIREAAELAARNCVTADRDFIPASESNLAVESPSGARTFFDVSRSGEVTPACRVTKDDRWTNLRKEAAP